MTRYVCGYEQKDEEEVVDRVPLRPVENLYVQYSAEPQWRMWRSEADMHCGYLRGCNVHVGSHFCDFQVEEISGDEFAIACITHPEDLKVVETSHSRSE